MPQRNQIAWIGVVVSFLFTVLINADRIAKFLGILNIPKDVRELLTALADVPTLLAWAILIVGLCCLAFLYQDAIESARVRILRFTRGWKLQRPLVRTNANVSPSRNGKRAATTDGIEREGPLEWKFNDPYSIFGTSRRFGEGLWIDAYQILGRNVSDFPLHDIRASIRPDMTGEAVSLNFFLDGQQVRPENTLGIPPRTDFVLGLVLPSPDPTRSQGMPAERFLVETGGLAFDFEYHQQGNSTGYRKYFPLATIEGMLSQLEHATRAQVAPKIRIQHKPSAPPIPPRQLPPSEVDERLKGIKHILGLLNEAQESMDFAHEMKHKAIGAYGNRSEAELYIFDLGRCRNTLNELAGTVSAFSVQNPQHEELAATLTAVPILSAVAAIEHFRTAFDMLTRDLREGTERAVFSYLFQPFVTELDAALEALHRWKAGTSDSAVQMRRKLLQ